MVHKGSLPKFDPGIYTKIALNDLIVYSIHYLQDNGNEITPEDVISACFHLFPKRFSLRKYPHWPDSAVVSRRWSECRSKKYIVGTVALGFKLTPKGSKYAGKVAEKLGAAKPRQAVKAHPAKKIVIAHSHTIAPIVQAKSADKTSRFAREKKTHTSRPKKVVAPIRVKKTRRIRSEKPRSPVQVKEVPRPVQLEKKLHPVLVDKKHPAQSRVSKEVKIRAGKFVRMMEKSDAYIHYKKNGKNSKISEFDFRSLLLCTMESSRETLTRNVELFKDYARVHDRQDLVAFLTYCEEYFFSLLKPHPLKKIGRKK